MVDDDISIRPATIADVADVVRLRRAMFEAMGCDDTVQLDAADVAAARFFAAAISTDAFHGWLAVTPQGTAVGSGGLVIDQHPPSPGNLSGRIGYIMNVVTIPAYRRQGIARRMMQLMLKWLAERDIQRVTLHASEMGRPLYEELGFTFSNEMKRALDGEPVQEQQKNR